MNNAQIIRSIIFAWADIETGGLDDKLKNGELGMQVYPILEIAIHLTDADLNIIDGDGFRVVIHHPEEVLQSMDQWSIDQHTKTGLLDEVRQSTITLAEAEQMALAHLKKHNAEPYNMKEKRGTVMAGNSIKLDRNYLCCQMPALHEYFHYRQADVSAIALFVREWRPDIEASVQKKYQHLAMEDLRESIMEAKVYKDRLFNKDAVVSKSGSTDVLGSILFLAEDMTRALQRFDFDAPEYLNDPAIQNLKRDLKNLHDRQVGLANDVTQG
ncbi:oligoribonuclease [Vibrio sp. Vb5031]|nr:MULTISPECIES: oligoribonuclease [Vibrio]MDW1505753.1 oligoribonuclease [Vibrio sp. Vb5031]MDW1517466.1 oligoribonuclease [Vibrio sp. Vb5035]MDW1547595.1 oligoribonuclease [Vibrio sp. Vb5034]MDW2456215.1 oligoribonuclease [Vibrio sp. 1249-1]